MTATSELILSTKVSPHQGSITVFFVAGNSKPVEVLGTHLWCMQMQGNLQTQGFMQN